MKQKIFFHESKLQCFRTVLPYKTIYWQEYYLANLIVKSNWWILYWRFKLPCLPSRVPSTVQRKYFVGYKFHVFAKILILRKINFTNYKHNLATTIGVLSFPRK